MWPTPAASAVCCFIGVNRTGRTLMLTSTPQLHTCPRDLFFSGACVLSQDSVFIPGLADSDLSQAKGNHSCGAAFIADVPIAKLLAENNTPRGAFVFGVDFRVWHVSDDVIISCLWS